MPGQTGGGGAAQATGLGRCPICEQGEVVESRKAFGCSRWRDGCGLTIWKHLSGHRVTGQEIKQLLAGGRSDLIDDFKSKAGKPFSAKLRLDENGKIGFEFEREPARPSEPAPALASVRAPAQDRAQGRGASSVPAAKLPSLGSGRADRLPCPRCRQGKVIEGHHAYGCNRWREGCHFRVPKWIGEYRLSETELRALIQQGQAELTTARVQLRLDDRQQLVVVTRE
jgi:DNA topoisomerase-3